MIREIKFRGKRIDNNEWVFGYYWFNCENNTHCITVSSLGADNFINFIVDLKTIGEVTGAKDKDGKDIYEGDIVRTDKNLKQWQIVYKNFSWYVDATHIKYDGKHSRLAKIDEKYDLWGYLYLIKKVNGKLEVIGNVYENAELIGINTTF